VVTTNSSTARDGPIPKSVMHESKVVFFPHPRHVVWLDDYALWCVQTPFGRIESLRPTLRFRMALASGARQLEFMKS
jgi:hypothetical protein